MDIKDKINNIKKEIPPDIQFLAVIKDQSNERVQDALNSGITIFGENYLKEAEEHYHILKDKATFQFIGHLQSNKVKKAIEMFDILTIDSQKIAQEINVRANEQKKVLIEVNIAREEKKSGVLPEKVIELINSISQLNNIKIIGLLTMGPNLDSEKLRPYFKQCKELFEEIKELRINNVDMHILSMGMSDSYQVAIEEGATQVRIGKLLFN